MDIADFSVYQAARERIRIVDVAQALLLSRGVEAVQLMDVAIALRIPLAAVERQFPDGMPFLLQASLEAHLREIHARLLAQRQECGSAVEELLAMRQLLLQQINDTRSLFLQELATSHPQLSHRLCRLRVAFMWRYLQYNLQRGIREAYYHTNLPIRITLGTWLRQVGRTEAAVTSADELIAVYDTLFTQLLADITTALGAFVMHRLQQTPPYY